MIELGFWEEAILNNAAAWGVTYLLHSTVLLASVWVGTRALGLAPSVENALWRAALILAPITTTARIAIEHVEGVVAAGPDALAVAGAAGSVLITTGVVCTFIALWFAGRLGRAACRERARLSDRIPLVDGPELDLLASVAQRVGRPLPRLTVSSRITSPIAIGSREICVPAETFRRLTPEVQSAVFAHELAHLERRDPGWIALARVFENVFFLQPLQRLARARLRETSEYMADAFAIRQVGEPESLISGLATLARATGQGYATAAFAPESLLLRRVNRILGTGRPERSIPRWGLFASLSLLVGLIWLLPAVVPAYDCRVTGLAPAVESWLLLHL